MELRTFPKLFLVATIALLLIATANGAPPSFTNTTRDTNINTTDTSRVTTEVVTTGNVNISGNIEYHVAARAKTCSLIPRNKTLVEDVEKALKDGFSMIEYKLLFREEEIIPSTVNGKENSQMFKPFFWVRSTGRFSTRLLLLKPNYDIMSFKTLELRVRKFKRIDLVEYPSNCLDGLTYHDIELILRELILNNFRNTTPGDKENQDLTDSVCNLHIRDLSGADFTYYCCHRDDNMHMKCEYLQSDTWLDLMRAVIRILKALVILFCPYLIPAKLYRDATAKTPFFYNLKKEKKISLTLKHVHEWVREKSNRYKKKRTTTNMPKQELFIRLSKLKHMTQFKKYVQNLKEGTKKVCTINQAQIVDEDRLIDHGEAPVSIFPTLYEFIVNCRVRELASVAECCDSNIFKKLGCRLTWFSCMKRFMWFVVMICLIIPWYIRLFVYFRYEKKEITLRREAAEDKGYAFPFQGNFTLYLTPVHGVFIICYIFLAFDGIFMTQFSGKYKEKFQLVFRKCFQDMNSDSRTKAFGGIVQLLLRPFTSLGCWVIFGGLFMWILLVPIAVLFLTFFMFPTVNLTVRLLAHLVVYVVEPKPLTNTDDTESEKSSSTTVSDQSSDKEIVEDLKNRGCLHVLRKRLAPTNFDLQELLRAIDFVKDKRSLRTFHGRVVQVLVILFCLVTLYTSIIIAFELITFFMDLFIYTFIGLVLYANYTMTYISLVVLLLVYGKDCFGGVSDTYRAFSSTLNSYFLGHCEKEAVVEFFKPEKEQSNKAFLVDPCAQNDDPCKPGKSPDITRAQLTDEFDHNLCWKLRKVAFFLTKDDKPKIPSKLFFQACTMPYKNSPGRLLHAYLKALIHYLVIVAFLLFVLLVVITFGESHKISASNQLLATIAGGILPFLLRNFIFMKHKNAQIDPEKDIDFRVAIHNLVNEYEQDWIAYDLDVKETSGDTAETVIGDDDSFTTVNTSQEENVADATESDKSDTISISNETKALSEETEMKKPNGINGIKGINGHAKQAQLTAHKGVTFVERETEETIETNPENVKNDLPDTNGTDSENITDIVIIYDNEEVDWFDFPVLYKRRPSMAPFLLSMEEAECQDVQ